MVLVAEWRVATDAEAHDARRVRIFADNADGESAGSGEHLHPRSQCRRLSFTRVGLRERIDDLGCTPGRFVQPAVDRQAAIHHAGANGRRYVFLGRAQGRPGQSREHYPDGCAGPLPIRLRLQNGGTVWHARCRWRCDVTGMPISG